MTGNHYERLPQPPLCQHRGWRFDQPNRLLVSQPEERGAPGTYLSKVFNLPPGSPIVCLVAPPKEDLVGLDAAFKAPDVRIAALTVPPTNLPARPPVAVFQNGVPEAVVHPTNY